MEGAGFRDRNSICLGLRPSAESGFFVIKRVCLSPCHRLSKDRMLLTWKVGRSSATTWRFLSCASSPAAQQHATGPLPSVCRRLLERQRGSVYGSLHVSRPTRFRNAHTGARRGQRRHVEVTSQQCIPMQIHPSNQLPPRATRGWQAVRQLARRNPTSTSTCRVGCRVHNPPSKFAPPFRASGGFAARRDHKRFTSTGYSAALSWLACIRSQTRRKGGIPGVYIRESPYHKVLPSLENSPPVAHMETTSTRLGAGGRREKRTKINYAVGGDDASHACASCLLVAGSSGWRSSLEPSRPCRSAASAPLRLGGGGEGAALC